MISVIIPTLNEERSLPLLLDALRGEKVEHEVVVVDGGSEDRTVAIARTYGARALSAGPGRGNQICTGVQVSRGDSALGPARGQYPARRCAWCDRAGSCGGPGFNWWKFPACFRGQYRLQPVADPLLCPAEMVRPVLWRFGIFVRRSVHDAIGGFRPIPVMEDLDFVRRLERFGRTGCIREPALITSLRRFEGRRALVIVRGWIQLHVLFWLGMSPERLARIYQNHAPRDRGWG